MLLDFEIIDGLNNILDYDNKTIIPEIISLLNEISSYISNMKSFQY